MADNPFAKYAPSVPAQSGPVYGPPPKAEKPPRAYDVQQDSIKNERSDRGEAFGNAMDLRKQFDGLQPIKTYRVAIPQYAQALQTADTPAGDLALTYAFAKIMDPDSVVRDGEQAAVANTDTIAGQVAARLKKELARTGTFSPQTRADLRREAHLKIAALNKIYNQQRARFKADALEFGVNPDRVMGSHDGRDYYDTIAKYWAKNGGNPLKPKPKAKAPANDGWVIEEMP